MTPEFNCFLRFTLPALPLFLLSYEDLKTHRLSLMGILLLQNLGLGYTIMVRNLSVHSFALWLLLLLAGALVGHQETQSLGEGDLYVLSGLSLFHTPGELLLIFCLSVWLLFPYTLRAFLKLKRLERYSLARDSPPGVAPTYIEHEKGASLAELPLIPALFAARQMLGLAVRLL